MPTTRRHRHQLISLALILLLLLSSVVTASEVSAHTLCDQDGKLVLVELSDSDNTSADNRIPDQGAHEHICHVHPPAHSLSSGTLLTLDRPANNFPPLLVALTDVTTAPPVPPPNA